MNLINKHISRVVLVYSLRSLMSLVAKLSVKFSRPRIGWFRIVKAPTVSKRLLYHFYKRLSLKEFLSLFWKQKLLEVFCVHCETTTRLEITRLKWSDDKNFSKFENGHVHRQWLVKTIWSYWKQNDCGISESLNLSKVMINDQWCWWDRSGTLLGGRPFSSCKTSFS